jgi:hypothetical protein
MVMKQQLVVTNRYTILKETKKILPILNRPTLKQVKAVFCGHNILAESLFVSQLSTNAEISV